MRLYGDVKLTSDLLLRDVLFVPQFQFNLLYVSALTASSPFTVSFYSNHCMIHNSTNRTMIGRGNKSQDLYVLEVDNAHMMTQIDSLHSRSSTMFFNKVSAQV